MKESHKVLFIIMILFYALLSVNPALARNSELKNKHSMTLNKPRIIVLTDAEIDDQCSMVRFLLYADDFNIDGIITTSSQYHSYGHNWAGDHWVDPYMDAYSKVYPNLKKNDSAYPTPGYIKAHTFLGNVKSEGDMSESTPGSRHIVKVLLDESNNQPIWFLAWGGTNTLGRALKTIQEKYPAKMAYVAKKMRFFFIWEQDNTYQSYIKPNWGKYNILTIISDQFQAIAYDWGKIIPKEKQEVFTGAWMNQHIIQNHGPLTALYRVHKNGDFISEGDSPSFIYCIINGLRNGELNHPNWGSWGGRYIRVRANTWLDPVPEPGYKYSEGRWYTNTAWGRVHMRSYAKDKKLIIEYFKPIWRWVVPLQNDFAARASWCIEPYAKANHPPVVKLDMKDSLNQKARPGEIVHLSAKGSYDPDNNNLIYHWGQYLEAGTCKDLIKIRNAGKRDASFTVPGNASKGETIHIICTVKDTGTPQLTRYARAIVEVE